MVNKTDMGKRHEEFIALVFGGSPTKGSGNQWSAPNDTRDNHHAVPFALSFQCKSTAGASLSVSRETILKAVEEAGGELPAFALRWYPNERLDHLGVNDDWAALRTADLDEILAAARRSIQLERLNLIDTEKTQLARAATERAIQLQEALAEAQRENEQLQADSLQIMTDGATRSENPQAPPGHLVVRMPDTWTDEEIHQFSLDLEAEMSRRQSPAVAQPDTVVVYAFRTGEEPVRMRFQGVRISRHGGRIEFSVSTVRIERSIDNKPRLMVNDCLIARGEYWLDGVIQCRTYDPVLG